MPAVTSFNLGAKIAIETDRGSAPSGVVNGRGWWEGGRWFSIVTEGVPNARDMQAVIFPSGHAGDRRMNQQPPVVGRRWSEAEMSGPVVADYLGALLYAAMGAASTDMIPHTTASLLAASIIETNPQSYSLTNQPNEGGAIMRFELKGGASNGDVSVSGIDVYGNGASEIVHFGSGNTTIYTRTSFSSVGALGVAVSGVTSGSITITAIKRFVHTFTNASSSPHLSIEKMGDPQAGNASRSFIYVGQLLRELTIENNAGQEDGVMMMSFSTVGEPTGGITGTSAQTTIHAPSPLKIWPAWFMQVSRDGGTYNVVENFSITHSTNNRNVFAAANAQGPQQGLYGSVEATGNMTIIVENEGEYNRWRGASEMRLHAMWGSGNSNGWKATSVLNYYLNASLPVYFEDLNLEESDDALMVSGTFRVVRNDSYPYQFQLGNGTPQKAYGAGTGV